MSCLAFLAINAVYSTLRHCEAQFRVCLESIQSSDTTSPKQSPCTGFAMTSVQGDCFVASILQSSANVGLLWVSPINAPRNDEWKRKAEIMTIQSQLFGTALAYLLLHGSVTRV
jgi:hypothetical protein